MDGLIPGNLLLFGEYAVLEEKGKGISAAVYPAVSWTAGDGSGLSGRQGSKAWEYESSDISSGTGRKNLLYFCRQQCCHLAESLGRELSANKVHIDSTSFVSEGRKLGFGSSAAAAAAAVTAILSTQTWRKDVSREQIMNTAYFAHSGFQQKSGSGYDVYTRLSSGINLFTGGTDRQIKRTELPWLGFLGCFSGRKSVSTVKSVSGYGMWKKDNPDKCLQYAERSNDLISMLENADNWNDAAALINEIRELGQRLGTEIDVPAGFDIPAGLADYSDAVCKASGAGNELILVFSDKPVENVPGIEKIELFEV
jgi:phosphomevalonate kinase